MGLSSKGGIVLRNAPEPNSPIGQYNLPSIDSYPFPKAFRERLKRGLVVSSMGIDAMDGVISLKDWVMGRKRGQAPHQEKLNCRNATLPRRGRWRRGC